MKQILASLILILALVCSFTPDIRGQDDYSNQIYFDTLTADTIAVTIPITVTGEGVLQIQIDTTATVGTGTVSAIGATLKGKTYTSAKYLASGETVSVGTLNHIRWHTSMGQLEFRLAGNRALAVRICIQWTPGATYVPSG